MKICKVYQLGIVDYKKAWDIQDQLAEKISLGIQPPSLLLLEHPHVYSFGKQGQKENLIWAQDELDRRGIDVQWSDRGGDVTYHGPGQLVGYPLLPLTMGEIEIDPITKKARLPKTNYVGYLRNLEKVLIKTLFKYAIGGGQIQGQTGVWVQGDVPSRCVHCPPDIFSSPAKIACIGVKVDAKGISRHGFALNVSVDMDYWKGILACGLENQNKASMDYFLNPPPLISDVSEKLIEAFSQVFSYKIEISDWDNCLIE